MAELFDVQVSAISKQLKNIFEDGELDEEVVISVLETTTQHGAIDGKTQTNETKFYNLEAILAVGYRVRSRRGVHFRRWASNIIKEYMKKGFAMNDDLLKQAGGGTYFKELLDRIRDIRSSEKVFYRQVLDLFATSVDYDPKTDTAQRFFVEMQNMLYYSVNGQTAPEMIAKRANADDPFMGLMSFKGLRPTKAEVTVAKNYLGEKEIKELNLMVSAYLELAELKATDGILMKMKDWADELVRFITFRQKPVLTHGGSILREDADEMALEQYKAYKAKSSAELTQVEKDFIDTVKKTYALLEGKSGKREGEDE
jgi:hypothetical protein